MTERLDVEELLTELYQASKGVDAASTELARITKAFATGEDGLGLGARYEIAIDSALMAIQEEADKAGRRPPAEDVRAAQARLRVRSTDPELEREHRRVITEMKALQTWISSQKQVISARQSVVNGLRAIGA